MDEDRTLFLPPTFPASPTTLPASPFFNRLLRFAHSAPPRLCVRDANTGNEYTHLQLLTAAFSLRSRIWHEYLSSATRERLTRGKEVYVAILAPGGWEYAVAVVAVLALGAAIVPLTVALPAEEALYFVQKAGVVGVLCSEGALPLGKELEALVQRQESTNTNANALGEVKNVAAIPISPSLHNPPLKPSEIFISTNRYLDDSAPGVVIFTSGTTGPPKAAVMRRGFIHDTATAVADHYNLTPADTLLHILPVHHATGIGINFFPALIAGCVIEFRSGSFSAEWVWNRLRKGGVTVFSGVPTIYMRLQRHYEQVLSRLPSPELQAYVAGARGLKAALCGTSALPHPIAMFWSRILGRKILLRFGATEFGAVVKVRLGDEDVPDGSVGKVFPGCDVRLLDPETGEYGDHGEIVIRSPSGEMFGKYLHDPVATRKAHTAEGYFRSGDIARRDERGYFFIEGRASIDIIKSGGYKISALDIEREVLGLDYVAEVMVVGVPDLEFGERVAAAVVLKAPGDQKGGALHSPPGERSEPNEQHSEQGQQEQVVTHLTLSQLRSDLRKRLAGYKMPTLLRVLHAELPKSGTGKVVKKVLGPQFFPRGCEGMGEVQVWVPTERMGKL